MAFVIFNLDRRILNISFFIEQDKYNKKDFVKNIRKRKMEGVW